MNESATLEQINLRQSSYQDIGRVTHGNLRSNDSRHAGQTFVSPLRPECTSQCRGAWLGNGWSNDGVGPRVMGAFVAVIELAACALKDQQVTPRTREKLAGQERTGNLRLPARMDHQSDCVASFCQETT